MYCPKCGNELDDNANFCKYCGAETTVNGIVSSENALGMKVNPKTLILFAFIAANVLTAFSGFISLFSGSLINDWTKKESAKAFSKYGIMPESQSLSFVGMTKYFKDELVLSILKWSVYGLMVITAIFIILSIIRLFGKETGSADCFYNVIDRLIMASTFSAIQMVVFIMGKYFITSVEKVENSDLTFTVWFYILFVVTAFSLVVELYLFKKKN